MNEFEFNEEELDYDDFDEEEFAEVDALIESMSSLPHSEVMILNLECVKRMQLATAIFKRGLKDHCSDMSFTCKQDDLVPDIGYLEVEADTINFCHEEWFLRASEYADNVEIYPLTNHKARVTLGFNRLLIPMQ